MRRIDLLAWFLSICALVLTGPSLTEGQRLTDGHRHPSGTLTEPRLSLAAGVYSAPTWLPLRTRAKVGCVMTNCDGDYHGYWAIDFEQIVNQPGAPVYAAGAGQVHVLSRGTKCGPDGTPANALIVDHGGGIESVYFHLHDFAVADGAWVTERTVIAHVGSTGYTVPCPDNHLHFEVRRDGQVIYPGSLKACHGATLVTYPQALGYSNWNAIPPAMYAGGRIAPNNRTVFSDGTTCRASTTPTTGDLPGVSATYSAPSNYHVFGVDLATHRLLQTYYRPGVGWTPQLDLGGDLRGVPSVIYRPDVERYDVFAVGRDGRLWQRIFINRAWRPWTPLIEPGAGWGDGVAATFRAADRSYHLFTVASDGQLHQSFHRPGSGWRTQPIGGSLRGAVAVTYRPATNRYDVFGLAPDRTMRQRTYAGSKWLSWARVTSAGGGWAGLGAVVQPDGSYQVYGTRTDNKAYRTTYPSPGGWSTPQLLNGEVHGAPSVLYRPDQMRIDLFAPGMNDQVQQRTYAEGRWVAWRQLT